MKIDNVYKAKSLERLEISDISKEKELYNALASNLYFSVFNYMQSILKEPPEGKWKHLGIGSYFSRYCIENSLYPKKELKIFSKYYKELYELRRKADYINIKLDYEDVAKLLNIFEYFKEVIKNGYCERD